MKNMLRLLALCKALRRQVMVIGQVLVVHESKAELRTLGFLAGNLLLSCLRSSAMHFKRLGKDRVVESGR